MVLYVDGGCTGNSQRDLALRRMVMVVTDDHGRVLSEQTAEGGSNNIAELIAVRDALRWCLGRQITDVVVRTDSQNNLAWVNGSRVGKTINDLERVLVLRDEIARLRKTVALTLEWIPRASNKAGHYIERIYAC